MMREGREMVDSISRYEIGVNERCSIQHLGVDERGVGLVTTRGYGDVQLRIFSQFNDQGVRIRDNDTTSKFQWKYLLRESGKSMVEGVERGSQGSGYANGGRNYDGLVERSIPTESEMISNVPTYAYNVGSAEYCGSSRNVTGRLVEGPEFHGRIRNVVDLLVEDSEIYRHTRNVTRLPVKDAEYNGCTRNMTSLPVKEAEYNECAKKVTGLSVEDAEYHRRLRSVRTGPPVEDAENQRHTRGVTGRLAEDRVGVLPRDYQRHMDREVSMKSYEENCFSVRNGDSSRSLTPHSQSNGQHTPFQAISLTKLDDRHQEVFHHPANGLRLGGAIPPASCYSSDGIIYSKAGTNARPISSKGSTCPRAEYDENFGRHAEDMHPESQRSGKVYIRALSEDMYDNYSNVQDYIDHGDTYGNNTLNPTLPRHGYIGNSGTFPLEEDVLLSSDHTLQEAPIVDVDDVGRTAPQIEYGGPYLNSPNTYIDYGTEASHEILPREEECPYELDAHDVSHEAQMWNYPIFEEGYMNVDEDAQQGLEAIFFDLHDQPRIPKRKRGYVGKMSWPKHRTSTLGGGGALSSGHRHLTDEPENESVHRSRSSNRHFHSKAKAGLSKSGPRLPFAGLSRELQNRLSKPCETGSNNVKNRLKRPLFHGSQAPKFLRGNVNNCVKSPLNVNHISGTQLHGKAQRTSVKKRLKLAPHIDVWLPDPQVSHASLNLKLQQKQQKLASKNSGKTKEIDFSQEADPDHSILKVKPTESDPPENSGELKHQVDHWFIKCMVYLNANPGRQKKFKEQGKSGTMKCIICSSSKEFIQTKDVAMHAFTSLKVGLRAPHLGFHRALCVLMRWDPAVASNGRWVCTSLPDVEARALKEDVIVWPPVVIIHNGSARDLYNNEQVNISIKQLENSLRDMGLSEDKTTVCHGKPGTPNIMLVKFNGTLSGLLEAERLHNLFAVERRGRTELQEIDAGVRGTKRVSQEPEDKMENTLYGYLGTMEDFDKLNYDMRRHCVAKSKKVILACVDTAT